MNANDAAAKLNQIVSSKIAIDILNSVDVSTIEIFGVEGFLLGSNGDYESKLDLMFDLSSIKNLSRSEKASFIKQFIQNRAGDSIYFEVYGE